MSNRSAARVSPSRQGSVLRAARLARGWSLTRAAHEMIEVAATRGHALPDSTSMRRQLIRWEAGESNPGAFYRVLLESLFAITLEAPPPAPTPPEVTPKTALHAARLRVGWSLNSAVRELAKVAANHGQALPSAKYVRRQLIRWEAGTVIPSEFYRALLSALYKTSPSALGLPSRHVPTQPQQIPHRAIPRTWPRGGASLRYHRCRG
jgi:transcriptional regulator with XRE-family HTH domain